MSDTRLTVAISSDFLKALNKLPEKGRSKAATFISKFRNNPRSPGLNYERIEGGKDPMIRSLRVDQDIRCIVSAPEQGNTYVLLWIDKHDDAYQWARRRTCHVNRVSGALQVVDVEAAETAVGETNAGSPAPASLPSSEPTTAPAPELPMTPATARGDSNGQTGLFSACSNDDLMVLGVPEALLPAVRAVGNDEALARLIEWLPQDCVDGLILLADGKPIEAVIEELERQRPAHIDPSDVATALQTPESQAHFLVITDDEVLEAMLSAPLEQWRVFLHPSQRKLVDRHWNGPVRVLGGAGTGKTVVAMHRTAWLAQRLADAGEPGRVLFTTFTRNLATDIRSNLTKICSTEALQRIEVIHLDGWVMNFLKNQGLQVRVFDDQARDSCWSLAMDVADTTLGLDENFYSEEWQEVVLANGCRTRDDYLMARRVGRGTRLTRQNRAQIWPVFDALRAEFRQRGLWEPEEAKQAAADLLSNAAQAPLFTAVVVDEAQDLDVASFRLIRALAGEQHADDLFIVGDPHQRIYGKPVVLSRCGVEIRGRSRKLRINYRTTEETRAWATAVLQGLDFDDLDGGSDPASDYRSLLHGEHPLVQGFEDPADEQRFLVEKLRQIQQEQGSLSGTCVTARTQKAVEKLNGLLEREGFATRVIKASESDDPSDPALRLATMHRVKGLEFDQMFIPGLDSDQMPYRYILNRRPDQISREQFEQQERSLLHVAATRAKKRVVVTFTGQGSPYLSVE
ncbi:MULTISPECIES: UvrD-helicase domain-containing protein [unclassified Synechococcus]|uniref:UvrD-helicase domain-containing protein n=1 Tax=unclassified Synechococcus TaxID=2626047 RepID=UPI0008FF6584|nr:MULTISPECIES: UvrD-helicase domain-containing protein [unclassified Synechococcus]APD47018.1 DNA helicase [Synechococcus sp. SynAce01]MCT0245584.1 AAA family ATPase [Synechococcus sp. CS-601]TWB88998.1 UvrD-like helicase family protein [Synechococcus sp. Ace-Pa]